MITLSKAAINEIKRLKLKRQNPDARLRLGVQRGGCADLYYTMDFDEVVKEGDRISDCGGISVIVDGQSCEYILDLSLDYSEDLMGGGFRFHNPKALESCGCGNSFRVEG
ncbi:HesB/IscA family protein [Limnofasciculus baicalensis]|uniref:Iron-sulfur cluster assembly accessory protein n=1 Tax=Limnofasciculus baicalensis BBK-W-15 TaxID=2699891 RepID=A0AAE3GTF1_9CYAN|nr:iron-sulfur cluster assembly accessory protein [Limnofasciculus baicalensis]MCP2729687.1 iron-sulfur cluster assembly accessory protein [Limnofasciculus baicalensis BBK-W-15]